MSRSASAKPQPPGDNPRGGANILLLVLAASAAALYGSLAYVGAMEGRLGLYLPVHAALVVLMLLAVRSVGRQGGLGIALAAALAFRLIASFGPPALSDDVYRYVWDGRVQTHGFHPYAHAPADPHLADLRDANWERINHPEIRTIYPPGAQFVFAALASAGLGSRGFKLAFGLADFGVVLALVALCGRLRAPRARALLYAWNPLAIMETAGSGHLEPLGVLGVVLAVIWLVDRRAALSTIAWAWAVQVKLLPLALLPGLIRRWRARHLALATVAIALPFVPFALGGPALGPGLFDYAARWERNAFLFAGIDAAVGSFDTAATLEPVVAAIQSRIEPNWAGWDAVYRLVWPPSVARAIALVLALAWLAWLTFRPKLDAGREIFCGLGGVLLLAPTLHPWYLLWVLPGAAAFGWSGFLWLAATAPLAYIDVGGDVPWWARGVQFVPAVALMFFDWRRRPVPRRLR